MKQLLLAGYCCAALAGPTAAQHNEPRALVETVTATMQPVRQTVRAWGVVEADTNAVRVIALPRAGLVTRIVVRTGQRVAAGDALLVLDTAPETRLQFEQATAAQQYAASQWGLLQQLYTEQLATRDQVAAAKKSLADAEAQIAALKSVGADTRQQTLRASGAGIVVALNLAAGDRVSANTPAMQLASRDGLIVRLGLEPEDASRLQANNDVVLDSVFESNRHIASTIQTIGAMINPTTRLVDAIVPIPASAAAGVTIGSTLRADVMLTEQTVVVVPRSAVLHDAEGAYLFVVENHRARRVAVQVRYESSDSYGLAESMLDGAPVVLRGNYELHDGMAVREEESAP